MTIKWSDELSMANAKIDAEHQSLIELVNMLNTEIVSQQRSQDEIARIGDLILENMIPHCADEEQVLLEKNLVAEAQELQQDHTQLIDDVKKCLIAIKNHPHVRIWVESGLKIEALFTDHILNIDSKYQDYFRTE